MITCTTFPEVHLQTLLQIQKYIMSNKRTGVNFSIELLWLCIHMHNSWGDCSQLARPRCWATRWRPPPDQVNLWKTAFVLDRFFLSYPKRVLWNVKTRKKYTFIEVFTRVAVFGVSVFMWVCLHSISLSNQWHLPRLMSMELMFESVLNSLRSIYIAPNVYGLNYNGVLI